MGGMAEDGEDLSHEAARATRAGGLDVDARAVWGETRREGVAPELVRDGSSPRWRG